MEPIISVKGLRKVYRIGKEKVVALDRIDLDIMPGEICCIVGTSGSGKSTLLNQLAGLEKPTKGKVVIGKTNISVLSENKLARFRQKNVGFIFQSYNLLPTMTALENVSFPLMFRGVSKRVRNKRAKEMLKLVGLGNRTSHRPTQMSGGQQQRVGIARAFVAKPKIVFADEPTGNLDSRTTIEVMELMVNLCRKNKQTLVLVTHDRELSLYADRIITLIDGRIVSDVQNQSIASLSEEEKLALVSGMAETPGLPGEILQQLHEASGETEPLAEESPPNENSSEAGPLLKAPSGEAESTSGPGESTSEPKTDSGLQAAAPSQAAESGGHQNAEGNPEPAAPARENAAAEAEEPSPPPHKEDSWTKAPRAAEEMNAAP